MEVNVEGVWQSLYIPMCFNNNGWVGVGGHGGAEVSTVVSNLRDLAMSLCHSSICVEFVCSPFVIIEFPLSTFVPHHRT